MKNNKILNCYLALIILILSVLKVEASNINHFIDKAYQNSKIIQKENLQFLSTVEQYNIALKSLLPAIKVSIDKNAATIENNGYEEETPYKPKFKYDNIGDLPSKLLDNNWEPKLSLYYNFFNGGSILSHIRAARYSVDSQKLSLFHAEQKVLYESISAYVNYCTLLKKVDINNQNVELTKKLVQQESVKLELGESTKTDLASAEAQYNQALYQQIKTNSEFETAKQKFYNIFGEFPENDISLYYPKIPVQDHKEFKKLVFLNNYDYNIANINYKIALQNFRSNSGQVLPQISGSLSRARAPSTIQIDKDFYWNASVSITVPILDISSDIVNKSRIAKYNVRTATINKQEIIKNLNLEIVKSWSEFEAAKSSLTYTKSAVEAGELARDGSMHEMSVGTKTILDVLNAEIKLKEAKLNEVSAQSHYIISIYYLKYLLGDLTSESFNIKGRFNPSKEFRNRGGKVIL